MAKTKMTADDLLDQFKDMTLLELSDFVKKFEETFDVQAAMAAPMMVAAPGGVGGAGEEAEEQTEFDVVLTGAGDKKIQVIKEVRADEPRPEGSQGPRGFRAQAGSREGQQGGGRQGQGAAGRRRRRRRGQVGPGRCSESEPAGHRRRVACTSRMTVDSPSSNEAIGVAMSDERTFGQRLRATRIKAGYSQSDLEEISGIPKARLSRYENGHVAPSIQTLERLARALNVSEASLLGDDRALMEEFFYVLTTRGVRIASSEQAVALGSAVADIARALGMVDDGLKPVDDPPRLSPVGLTGSAAWRGDGQTRPSPWAAPQARGSITGFWRVDLRSEWG